jgi:hypothetical protein
VTDGIPVLLLDEVLPGTGPATGDLDSGDSRLGEGDATRPGV